MGARQLTKRQENFIQNYLESFNAMQSAIKAGYSEKFARHNSHKLLNHPAIKSAVEKDRIDPSYIKNVKDDNVRTLIRIRNLEIGKLDELLNTSKENTSPAIELRTQQQINRVRRAVESLAKLVGQYNESISLYAEANTTTNNFIDWEAIQHELSNAPQNPLIESNGTL